MADTQMRQSEAILALVDSETGQALRTDLEGQGWHSILTNSAAPIAKLLRVTSLLLAALISKSWLLDGLDSIIPIRPAT